MQAAAEQILTDARAAADAEIRRAALAAAAIAEEMAVPELEPGKWRKGRRYSGGRWQSEYAAALLPRDPGPPWPAALWDSLRTFATGIAAKARQLLKAEKELKAAADRERALSEALEAAPSPADLEAERGGRREAEERAAALSERLRELEPPRPAPEASPSFDPF